MPKLVANGAKLRCDQGLAPGVLTVLPVNMWAGQITVTDPGSDVDVV
jgi:hypothetical protein